jgi:amino acid adenylation domain-containing protein
VTGSSPSSPPTVADRVLRACKARAGEPAVVHGDRRVTYADLHATVASMRNRLREAGIGRGDRVVVCCERSPETIAAFVACLSLGACFIPVDPSQPARRIADIVARSGAALVLADAGIPVAGPTPLRRLTELTGTGEWSSCVGAGTDTAYVIFTSGSTGVPKGVMISQANLASYVDTAVALYPVRAEDRVLQVASLGFDWSVSEVYPTLAAGATLVLRSEDALTSAAALSREIDRHGVTMMQLPTAVWHSIAPDLLDHPERLPASLRHLTIGAEQASLELVRAWVRRFGPRVRLINGYGPTECTVEATRAELAGPDAVDVFARSAVPLGKPLPGCQVYVLDERSQPVPPDIPGLVFIGGTGVGQGYLDDPEATRHRFVPDPFRNPGALMYDTGDVGRWNEHGELEFIGRVDNQVKVGGFRVELEEVEFHIGRHPAVREVAVVLDRPTGTLSAFVVGGPLDIDVLRSWLSDQLPTHQIPTRINLLTALPRTVNDKVDRAALAGTAAAAEPAPAPAADGIEAEIAAVWAAVLGIDAVDPTADFFQLGGHSLLAMRLVGQLQKRLGVPVELRDLFRARTVRGLAELVAARQ